MNLRLDQDSILRRWSGPLTRELLRTSDSLGLGQVPAGRQPDALTTSVCGYCSTGCGLQLHLQKGEAVNLTPSGSYPVNQGMACPKGWEALSALEATNRATTPLLRDASGHLQPISWHEALSLFTQRFAGLLKTHGPDAAAFLSTGQMATEEMALLGGVAKFGLGFRHGDGNTRQCMATAVTAYKESFGFDAPPFTYADFEESDTLVFVGSNLCVAHPILWQRVLQNPKSPSIVVVDPRRTETAQAAAHHLAVQPGTDLTLLYGMASEILRRGWQDQAFVENHTQQFEAFRDHVKAFDSGRVYRDCGIREEALHAVVDQMAPSRRTSFWWTMGVNQGHQATRTAQALINLALLTGNIGKPGTGANSITGQCNAMGSRLFSLTTSLPAGRRFDIPEHREETARLWGLPVDRIPDQVGWAYDQIMEGIEAGVIQGLWVVATNTAHSWINQSRGRKALEKLDFLVVQDMYHDTETARLAHLVLPAAGWGEKEGTFINSERRIGPIQRVRRPPGQALPDFDIFRLVAAYAGCQDFFREWSTPADAFQVLKKLSRGTFCDFSGIQDLRELEASGGIQWPFPEDRPDRTPERRLFTDGHFPHADGRARFVFDEPSSPPIRTERAYPLRLLTGRGTSAQWHTQTRTAQSATLRSLYPEAIYLEIHPGDAKTLGLQPHQRVRVSSPHGSLTANWRPCHGLQPGQIFIPMHYPETNRLTPSLIDPHSRQPAYKIGVARIDPLDPQP